MKKIWAICSGGDWYDASCKHLTLPDGMDIEQEDENREEQLHKYHRKEADYPGSFTEYLISKGAVVPSDEQLEEYWEN